MSLLSNAEAGLVATLKQVAGESVNYVRLGVVTAIPEVVSYDVMDEQGFLTSVSSYDWSFAAADLVTLIPGPRAGDRIEATLNSVPMVFEAMPIGAKPCVEPADPDGQLIVIHTKRVS